jgi:coatomer subunit beta
MHANPSYRADLSPGEDALANLSIEKEGEDGPITGFVRIRSRSQGLALSLGSLKGLKAVTI